MSQNVLAGLLAGVVLAVILVAYFLVRGQGLVASFRELDESFASMSDKTLYILLLSMFMLMALVFGVFAGIVYNLWGSNMIYKSIAFGLVVLFSILAVAIKTPMMVNKVIWNLAIGLVLGIMVPVLASG